MARRGVAWRGSARLGPAVHGMTWQGLFELVVVPRIFWFSTAGPGVAMYGLAR